jgi:alpha-galactosidase
MKFLLWLETERATDHAAITSEHPEYFIPAGGGNYMLDLGNREACDYAIETVSKVLQEEGVDCYREDFNFNTIPAWEEADSRAPDRTGMAESLFITGFYRFWETLRERFPDLLIDNCASGGRRIDLMTSSLGIPMWRSDFQCFTIIPYLAEANQIHFDGLSRWLPYHACGTVVKDGDDYAFLSGALGATLIDVCNRLLFLPEENAFDFNWLRKMLEISKRMRQYISEDYYPLTEHPEDFRNYYAAEIIDPAAGAGWVAIFRRAACTADSISLQLKGIEPAAEYTVETYPETPVRTVNGSELAAMTVQMPDPRSCKVIFFRKK